MPGWDRVDLGAPLQGYRQKFSSTCPCRTLTSWLGGDHRDRRRAVAASRRSAPGGWPSCPAGAGGRVRGDPVRNVRQQGALERRAEPALLSASPRRPGPGPCRRLQVSGASRSFEGLGAAGWCAARRRSLRTPGSAPGWSVLSVSASALPCLRLHLQGRRRGWWEWIAYMSASVCASRMAAGTRPRMCTPGNAVASAARGSDLHGGDQHMRARAMIISIPDDHLRPHASWPVPPSLIPLRNAKSFLGLTFLPASCRLISMASTSLMVLRPVIHETAASALPPTMSNQGSGQQEDWRPNETIYTYHAEATWQQSILPVTGRGAVFVAARSPGNTSAHLQQPPGTQSAVSPITLIRIIACTTASRCTRRYTLDLEEQRRSPIPGG